MGVQAAIVSMMDAKVYYYDNQLLAFRHSEKLVIVWRVCKSNMVVIANKMNPSTPK